MIHLVFADTSLELVPQNLLNHPAVKNYAERFNKGKEILLDDSYHHSAMKNLKDFERRGRPDIIHFCLLEALGSPLCDEEEMKPYVHTYEKHLIKFDSKTRLPRNYNRFKGLMEEVLVYKKSKNGLIVMEENIDLVNLFADLECKTVIGLSSKGEKKKLEEIFKGNLSNIDVGVVIGAFPKGNFSKEVTNVVADLISIYSKPLDAWVVTSKVLCQIERIYGLI